MALTKDDMQGLLNAQKKDLVQEMDQRFDAHDQRIEKRLAEQEKRFDTRLKRTDQHLRQEMAKRFAEQEKRFNQKMTGLKQEFKEVKETVVSERKILQIFLDQQLRKTNHLIQQTATAQAKLKQRVDALENHPYLKPS